MSGETESSDVEVVYDKECPVCDFYCHAVDVAEGELVRVDARDPGEAMDEITALGLDIDEGMVVRIDGRIYYGADAIHELALRSNKKGLLNRFASFVFRSRGMARFFYPILKAMRNLLLKILGKTRINNLEEPGRDRF